MERVQATGATPAGAAFANGISTIATTQITGLVFLATEIRVGYYVTVDKGWGSTTLRYKVVAADSVAGTIDLELNATSSEINVTVTTVSEMYTDGNASEYARTVLSADERNDVQEEIANVIIDNGDALDGNNRAQLSNAVVKRAGDTITGALTVNGAITGLGNITAGNGIIGTNYLQSDSIIELTPGAGITADGVLLKDNDVEATEVRTNDISVKSGSIISVNNDIYAKALRSDEIDNATYGVDFVLGKLYSLKVKADRFVMGTASEKTIINHIPNLTDALLNAELNISGFINGTNLVRLITFMGPIPTTIGRYTFGVMNDDASAVSGTSGFNSVTLDTEVNKLTIGIKKIDADDYDLVAKHQFGGNIVANLHVELNY